MNKNQLLVAIALLTTTLSKATVYDLTVAKDGTGNYTSIQDAINAAPAGTGRTTIFIKKGVYHEKVFLGANNSSINKAISLIGENPDSVIISWDDYNGLVKPYYTGTSNITYGNAQSATLTVNTTGEFYMENITVKNTYTSKQAVAVFNYSDRQTFKNCRIVGFQDTHYTKKGRRFFFYRTTFEGGTDFIFGGGTCYFYQCTIKSLKGGQFITAPEDITYSASLPSGKTLRYGLIFRDCEVVSDGQLATGSVYLGRPWNIECGSLYLNCRLGSHIRPEGWSTWSGNESSAFFAEYNSLTADGAALADVSQRVSWSYQLTDSEVNNYLLLSKIYTAGSFSSAPVFDPVSRIVAPAPVTTVATDGQTLSWPAVDGVNGYVVYADGSAVGVTEAPSYKDTAVYSKTPCYTVRSVGQWGNLSVPDGTADTVTVAGMNKAINTVQTSIESKKYSKQPFSLKADCLLFQQLTDCRLYHLSGQLALAGRHLTSLSLARLPKGLYLMKASDARNKNYQVKINIEHE